MKEAATKPKEVASEAVSWRARKEREIAARQRRAAQDDTRVRRYERRKALREKELQVLEMWLCGESPTAIMEATGYTTYRGMMLARNRAIQRVHINPDEEFVRLFLQMRRTSETMYKKAEKGNTDASRELRGLNKRMSELLGVDAPKRSEVSGVGGGPIEIEQRQMEEVQQVREAVFDIVESHPELGPVIAQRLLEADGDAMDVVASVHESSDSD